MTAPRFKIVVCEHYADSAFERLRAVGEVTCLKLPGEDELIAALADADALLVRTYTRVTPPHRLLTPEHRVRPLADQHTIYFAEVLGVYRYE